MPNVSPALTLTTFNYIVQNLSEMNVFQILKTYGRSSLFKFAEALAYLRSEYMPSAKVFSPFMYIYSTQKFLMKNISHVKLH